jgi:hypothetical protein
MIAHASFSPVPISRANAISYPRVTLDEARGGNDLVTDFRMMVFDRFEFWYNFKRHYGSAA